MEEYLPDIVIGGAPKCGTTSVYNWLSRSDEIAPSISKESNFLLDEDCWLFSDKSFLAQGATGYKEVFPRRKSGQLYLESCAIYLYSKVALQFLSELECRVVFVIRDPVVRFESNYRYFFDVKGACCDLDFESFVHKMLTGEVETPNEQISKALEHGKYVVYLRDWYESLGDERIKTILLEDIQKNTRDTLAGLCEWLGIRSEFLEGMNFSAANVSYSAKNQHIHKCARFLSSFIKEGRLRNSLKEKYVSLNGRRKAKDGSEKLTEYYAKSIDELATFLGVDLSAWKE